MKQILIILVLISAFITSSCNQKSKPWLSFKNEEFGFKTDFPSQPNYAPQIADTDFGRMKFNIYQLDCSKNDNSDNLVYTVNYSEYPDSVMNRLANLDEFYRNSVNGMVTNVHGKLLQETIIDYKGHQGREIRIDFRDGLIVMTSRLILIGNKYYTLIVMTDSRKDFNKSIKRFFDSFETF